MSEQFALIFGLTYDITLMVLTGVLCIKSDSLAPYAILLLLVKPS